ncbi:hypothetical protein AB0G77_14530 [Streptomyces hygroscopicus]|uniref:hypothetical protein n=1 Tax=Streptomyces hygroscopicus TaxID=1912 RepID=UPI0033D26E2B
MTGLGDAYYATYLCAVYDPVPVSPARSGSAAAQLPDLPGQRRPLDTETTPAPTPAPEWSESLDDLIGIEAAAETDTSEPEGAGVRPAEAGGYGLWDAEAAAEQW